jgi:hypothetical protein
MSQEKVTGILEAPKYPPPQYGEMTTLDLLVKGVAQTNEPIGKDLVLPLIAMNMTIF